MAAIPRLHKETPLYSRVKSVSSQFKVLADSITSLVRMDETYTDPSGRTIVNHAASLIKQNADNILTRVEKNGVISSINQSSENIKIAAGRVDIEGAAIFTTGKLKKVVTSSQTQWYSSTSASQLSGGSWATTQPNVTAGRYLWERTVYNYSDNTQEYKPSENGVCVTAPTDIAKTVSSVDVEYAQGTSATAAPSSGWSTNAPTIAAGKYLWTRTKTVLKDNTTSYTKTTCISGDNGKLVTAAKEQYYLSTSASLCAGGSWVDTQPAWQSGKYIWTRTHLTYADGTTGVVNTTLATAINSVNVVANASVKSSTQLWFTKSDDTAPAKPTAKVTSASTAGNKWRVIVPTYNASYPNYFYCWQYEHMDGTFTWSDVVHDRSATETFGKIRGGLARSQLVYRSVAAGTNTLSANTTWVTQTGDVQNAWTTKRPTYSSDYPVLFTATQSQTVGQQAAGTTCSCTTPLKDDTLTVIDGGHITTGTIDASRVAVTNIDASNINTGTLDAERIGTGSIAIGKLSSAVQKQLNRDVAYRGVCSSDPTYRSKAVTCENFTLTEGATITVYNSTAQTRDDTISLGVVGSGGSLYVDYTVYVGGSETGPSNQLLWAAGSSITFVFTENHWEVADSPGTWDGGTCSVASGTAGKTASAGQCVLFKGASVKVRMTNDNTASSPVLNVQSLGAKAIYFGSTTTRPTKANGYSWKASSLVEFVFDGQYWRTGSRTYINGGDIVTGTIDAARIDTNTIKTQVLEAFDINAYNINADNINAGTLSGDRIQGGTIDGVTLKSQGDHQSVKVEDGLMKFYFNNDEYNSATIEATGHTEGALAITNRVGSFHAQFGSDMIHLVVTNQYGIMISSAGIKFYRMTGTGTNTVLDSWT
jgi:hypothetical protein